MSVGSAGLHYWTAQEHATSARPEGKRALRCGLPGRDLSDADLDADGRRFGIQAVASLVRDTALVITPWSSPP
jgi:hypothetical protein